MVSTVPSAGSAMGSATRAGTSFFVRATSYSCLFFGVGLPPSLVEHRVTIQTFVRSTRRWIWCTVGPPVYNSFRRSIERSYGTDARSGACWRARGMWARGRRGERWAHIRCIRPAVGGSVRRRARRPTAFRGSRSAALRPGRSRCSTGARTGLRRDRATRPSWRGCEWRPSPSGRRSRPHRRRRPRAPARLPVQNPEPTPVRVPGRAPEGTPSADPATPPEAPPLASGSPSAEGRGHRTPS